jgi:hypothetical protein
MTDHWPSAHDLFGGTSCELDRKPAVGLVTDDTGAAWLCAGHLKSYELAWRSIGRTVFGFLREAA